MKKIKTAVALSLLISSTLLFTSFFKDERGWKEIKTENSPEARHENAFVQAGGKFYLVGGRGMKPVEEFDPATKKWRTLAHPNMEMHHFQAAAYNGKIYVAGAFTGDYPHETPIPNVYIFDPTSNKWQKGPSIPVERRRGAAGAIIRDDKLYLVCGIVDGHYDGHVNWFDELDLNTGNWKTLPDAPRPRDHFQVAEAEGKFYIAGGRRSSAKTDEVFQLTVAEVDVYDIETKKWTTLPTNLPTQRAGCTSISFEGKLIVIGGESGEQKVSHSEVEVFDPAKNQWLTYPPLETGRHGTQATVYDSRIYIAAGSGDRGGGPELTSLEVY